MTKIKQLSKEILTATLQFIIIVLCGLVGGILILETLVYLTN
jgi:hypothetical protein